MLIVFLGYASAFIMGLVLGSMGGGGSILTVPILVYLFGLVPSEATVYSLCIVGCSALIGSIQYFRNNLVRLKIGFLFALPSFVGIYLSRNFMLPAIPSGVRDPVIMVSFAVLMLSASVSMIRKKTLKADSNGVRSFDLASKGFLVGMVTGFVGAGGGFLIVPALVFFAKFTMKEAVGTSLVVIAMNSLFGFFVSLSKLSGFRGELLIAILALSVIGILIGSRLAHRIPDEVLKKTFGFFVLIMGSFIILEQLSKLLSY